MIRRAFTMRLKPGALTEYRYHHDNVWPDLVAEIERSGIASITTFQNGLELFLVSEIKDEKAWDKLWTSQIHREWAKVMEPLMHLTDDGIVDAGELTEIFHLETPAGRSAAKGAARRASGSKKSSSARSKSSGKRKAVARTAGKASAKGARRGSKKSSAAGRGKGKKTSARRPK